MEKFKEIFLFHRMVYFLSYYNAFYLPYYFNLITRIFFFYFLLLLPTLFKKIKIKKIKIKKIKIEKIKIADTDRATAKFINGVLSVTLPKLQPTTIAKSRKINVTTDDKNILK
jgi:hypothetical protein